MCKYLGIRASKKGTWDTMVFLYPNQTTPPMVPPVPDKEGTGQPSFRILSFLYYTILIFWA